MSTYSILDPKKIIYTNKNKRATCWKVCLITQLSKETQINKDYWFLLPDLIIITIMIMTLKRRPIADEGVTKQSFMSCFHERILEQY
jgi:hypothetical protein